MPLAAESDIIVLIWLVYKRTGMSSSLLSYSSKGNTFHAGLFINTDQVFTIISFASLFFCEGRAYKSMYIYIYIYLVSINLKGLPMPSGDLNRIIEREREREEEEERESEGENRTNFHSGGRGYRLAKMWRENPSLFFFLFSSNLPKMTDSISKWRLCMLIYSSGFLCVP